jgi:hypothetical protein
MRIALLMSGQGRQSWLASNSINKNVIEPNNADCFLCINRDSLEPGTGDNDEEIISKVFKNIKSLVLTDDAYNKEVKELIDSNYIKIDAAYKKLNREKWDKPLNMHNTDQYFKLKKCAEAAVDYATKNGFKYDIMVRCRPDIGWLNKFDLSRPINPDLLYVNYSMYNVSSTQDAQFVPWVEDTCFFGSQDNMLKFCSAFSENMVDDLEICDERYDLTFATEKLLARVLLNTGIKYTGINDYFGYTGAGWIRPKLSKHLTNWSKSPNFHLIEKYSDGKTSGLGVYFDRIGQDIIMDETIN